MTNAAMLLLYFHCVGCFVYVFYYSLKTDKKPHAHYSGCCKVHVHVLVGTYMYVAIEVIIREHQSI